MKAAHNSTMLRCTHSGQVSRTAICIALGVLIATGTGHRVLANWLTGALNHSLSPRRPLSTLPLEIRQWKGVDVAMDAQVRRIAGDDDFVNRTYVDVGARRSVGLYVGFLGKPRSRMAHRPEVCYPAHGYRLLAQRCVRVDAGGQNLVPATLYEFESPESGKPRDLVLAMFLVNGQYIDGDTAGTTYNIRGPGLFGTAAAYLMRIQVSVQVSSDPSGDVALLSDFAAQVSPSLSAMMPEVHAPS
jgi:EpsI family protein